MPNKQNKLPPELERYLALCQRTYERMVRHGKWPWPDESGAPDSLNSDEVLELTDNQTDI